MNLGYRKEVTRMKRILNEKFNMKFAIKSNWMDMKNAYSFSILIQESKLKFQIFLERLMSVIT